MLVLRRAGAVLRTAAGSPVAVNYGSAPPSSRRASRAVGLVDRSELTKLELEAPAASWPR